MNEDHRIAKVIGPPGTGKTTYVLSLIEKAAQKYDPSRVGAVSYTNAAVEEMRKRVVRSARCSEKTVKNVRTIHSLCFQLLGLDEGCVADSKLEEWNEQNPNFSLRPPTSDEIDADPYMRSYRDNINLKMFQQIQMMRNMRIPVESCQDDQVILMHHAWMKWLEESNYFDYTAMLEKVLEFELVPEIDVLFVDEAQDLTPLQLDIMVMWGENVKSSVFVGDSDQAIYRWAGAVPERFINLTNTWSNVLKKSYRVPEQVYRTAMEVVKQIAQREEIEYHPTDSIGKYWGIITEPDLSLEGTHMIITRCNYHLTRWREMLIRNGIPWHNPYRPSDLSFNPTKTKGWRAANTYLTLKGGEEAVSSKDFKDMVAVLGAKGNIIRGMKGKVEETIPDDIRINRTSTATLGIFTEEFLTYDKPIDRLFVFSEVAGRLIKSLPEEKLTEKPNIILGTVHSVKGGEADHVWYDSSTSPQILEALSPCREEYQDAFDDEARVSYVACTRARQTLGILTPRGKFFNPTLQTIT